MRRAAALLLAVVGCASPRAAPQVKTPHEARPAARVAPAVAVVDPLPSLDELTQRGALVAPGMRAVASRDETAAGEVSEVTRASADLCLRMTFVATSNVTAQLEDASATRLAEKKGASRGELAEKGPICVRRGEVVRVRFEGESRPRVRWVAFASGP